MKKVILILMMILFTMCSVNYSEQDIISNDTLSMGDTISNDSLSENLNYVIIDSIKTVEANNVNYFYDGLAVFFHYNGTNVLSYRIYYTIEQTLSLDDQYIEVDGEENFGIIPDNKLIDGMIYKIGVVAIIPDGYTILKDIRTIKYVLK